MDLISVIVTVYNVEKYIIYCLDSILNQTYSNIEVIVVIDGSKDNCAELIYSHYSDNKKVKIINRKENKGLLFSRCEGLKYAHGDIVMFCDSDDWVDNNMIEIMYNSMVHNNADFVKCSYIREHIDHQEIINLSSDNISIFDKEQVEHMILPHFILDSKFNNIWGELFYKKLININEIDTNVAMGEDIILNCQIYQNFNKMVLLSKPLYHYRNNPASMTNVYSFDKLQRNYTDVIKAQWFKINLIKYYQSDKLDIYIYESNINTIFDQAMKISLYSNIKFKEAKSYIYERLNTKLPLPVTQVMIHNLNIVLKIKLYVIRYNKIIVPYVWGIFERLRYRKHV